MRELAIIAYLMVGLGGAINHADRNPDQGFWHEGSVMVVCVAFWPLAVGAVVDQYLHEHCPTGKCLP